MTRIVPVAGDCYVCPSNPPGDHGAAQPVVRRATPAAAAIGIDGDDDLRRTRDVAYENAANGVFFDRTRMAEADGIQCPDPRLAEPRTSATAHDLQDAPKISMTIAYIQAKGDGTTKTLMFSREPGRAVLGLSGRTTTARRRTPASTSASTGCSPTDVGSNPNAPHQRLEGTPTIHDASTKWRSLHRRRRLPTTT